MRWRDHGNASQMMGKNNRNNGCEGGIMGTPAQMMGKKAGIMDALVELWKMQRASEKKQQHFVKSAGKYGFSKRIQENTTGFPKKLLEGPFFYQPFRSHRGKSYYFNCCCYTHREFSNCCQQKRQLPANLQYYRWLYGSLTGFLFLLRALAFFCWIF
jgi:hypothetical protein